MWGDAQFLADPGLFAEKRLGLTPDLKQAELLRGNLRRVLLNCSRQWGKSTITAALALHRALYEEDSLTIVVSPTLRQSGEFLRKAKGFARKLGMRVRGDGDNEISLLLPNQSRIVGLPGTEATVRGFSRPSLIVIDEAARVLDELYKAVRPMLATGDPCRFRTRAAVFLPICAHPRMRCTPHPLPRAHSMRFKSARVTGRALSRSLRW